MRSDRFLRRFRVELSNFRLPRSSVNDYRGDVIHLHRESLLCYSNVRRDLRKCYMRDESGVRRRKIQ